MKVAIIGGTGKMGRWFTRFFLDEGMQVIVSGRSKGKLLKMKDELGVEIADNVKAVEGADRVLISVPIENFEGVVREIHRYIGSDQEVMDICSVKEFPVRVMHEYIKNGTTLGTHPMFGPRADKIQNQNFILTPTDNKERKFANDFKSWLEEKQVNVSIMSPRKHDELMSAVLGLPHFIGMVVYDTLLNCVDLIETNRVAGTSYKLLLTLAETVASQDPEFFASLQTSLPKIKSVEGLFCEKSTEWLDVVGQKDRTALADKMRFVRAKLEKIGMHRSA